MTAAMIKIVFDKMIKILKQLFKNLKNTEKHTKSKNQGKKWILVNLKKIFKKKFKVKNNFIIN